MTKLHLSIAFVACFVLCPLASAQTGIITTIAGSSWVFPSNVSSALNAPFGKVYGVLTDSQGNVYVSDTGSNLVFRLSPGGGIQIVAGNGAPIVGAPLFTGAPLLVGDGGPATSAVLNAPKGLAVDASGNLYIADSGDNRIRKVSPDGIISTVAGNGLFDFGGDGRLATTADLANPCGVAVDASGNLFIADTSNQRIREVSASGIITTVAGSGPSTFGSFSGDGGPATSAMLNKPTGVAVDSSGNLFIADSLNSRVRKVSANGVITTLIYYGMPTGVAVDGSGNVYVADTLGYVEKLPAGGVLTTIAGYGQLPGEIEVGFSGDGGPATSASLFSPSGVAIDTAGNLLIADTFNYRIRTVSPAGIITTLAGNGQFEFSGDGGPATSANLASPSAVVVDHAGNIFIADNGTNRIRQVSPSGIITTVAGNGIPGFSGDGGPATAASLNLGLFPTSGADPTGVAVDSSGNLFIADSENGRIRKVSPAGIITTFAGGGNSGSSGDGGPATAATLGFVTGIALDALGDLFFVDGYRIRRVSADGIITTIAGSISTYGNTGDGGPATAALLYPTGGLAVDNAGNLFVADAYGIRKISVDGIITTVALGPGSGAPFSNPSSIAVDGSGNFFVSSWGTPKVFEVSTGGVLTTVAGNGSYFFSGDGGPATSAAIYDPEGIALDPFGNLLIADWGDNRIRKVAGVAVPPSVAVSPASLNLSLFTGSSSSQQFSLSGAINVPWTASTSASWLTLTPNSGTTPATFTALVDAKNLQPGSYTTGITISNPLASPAQEIVSVTLTVNAASLFVAPSALNFQLQQGSPAQSQALVIEGSVGTLWQVVASTSTGGVWLSLSPGSGPIPALLTALADPGNLAAGTYQGTIIVQAPGSLLPSSVVNVTLSVTPSNGQSGIINTVAGNGTAGYSGDGLPAPLTSLNVPTGVAIDAFGDLFIADSGNNLVRMVSLDGVMISVAGDGNQGFSGDGGAAIAASLSSPSGVAVDASGNLYIADSGNNRIREVTVAGVMTTVAGSGTQGFSGDGGPAVSASLNAPSGIAVDASGDLFIADSGNNRVREASVNGVMMTVAGNGIPGFSGDGGPAVSASLNAPLGVAVDASGNLLIADSGNNRIREVSANGAIRTAGGSGTQGFAGDGGPAVLAQLSAPAGVALDAFGDLFIADSGNSRVREVLPSGNITTVAGNGTNTSSGDGGQATAASLSDPTGVTVDASGDLFIADSSASRIREVSAVSSCANVGGSWNASESGSANYSVVSPIETDSFANPVGGTGVVTIAQTGCSIRYAPIGESGLIGTGLTPSQIASMTRSGTVNGDNVSVTGLSALVDTVAAAEAGLTITDIASNLLTGTGQVVNGVMTLDETGSFSASGTYSIDGQSGSFTVTVTTASVATFDPTSGAQPAVRSAGLRVALDGGAQASAVARVRAALGKALILGNR